MKAKSTKPAKPAAKRKSRKPPLDPRPIQRLLHGRANGDPAPNHFDAADPSLPPDFIVNHVRIPNPFEQQLAAVVKCATEGRDHAINQQRIAEDRLTALSVAHANLRTVLQDILAAATIFEQNIRSASRKQSNVKWALHLLANARKSSDKANGAYLAAKAENAANATWTEPT